MTEAKDLYDKAMKLGSSVDENFLELGKTLRDLLDKDPAMFQSFVKTSGHGKRKTYCLVEIDKAFRKMAAPKPRLLSIGWTKLYLIAKYVTTNNLNKFLTLCEESSVPQLKAALRDGKTGKLQETLHAVNFNLKADIYDALAEALINHGATPASRGLHNKEEALARMLAKLKKIPKDAR